MVCRSWQVILLLSLLTVGAPVAFTSNKHNGDVPSFSRLRTAKVLLGTLEDAQQPILGAITARSASLGDGPYRNTEAWGDLPSLRLYLVGHDPARPEALRQELASRGCSVLSYVPDDTWLVAGTPQAVREAVTETGVLAAAYEAGYKVAPEWAELQWGIERSIDTEGPAQHAPDREVGSRRHLGSTASSRGFEAVNGGTQEGWLSTLQTLASVPSVVSRLSARRRLAALGPGSAPPQYAVSVQLMALVPGAALEAAEEDWAAALWQHLGAAGPEGCRPVVAAPRHHATGRVLDVEGGAYAATLRVFLCEEDLMRGVWWLASLSVVTWVAPELRIVTSNAYASVVVQSGNTTNRSPLDPEVLPYRVRGLRGEDQIIGVGDTGLDMDSCFFSDQRLRSILTGSPGRIRLLAHRKVVQYYVAEDGSYGDDDGHGTHVAGSAAGSLGGNGSSLATGAAPDARISFIDMGPPGSEAAPLGSLFIPPALEVNYLPVHAQAGASITSDSWADSQGGGYNGNARGFDAFLWKNPEVVSFVVAGNSGPSSLSPRWSSSINAPGTSKNAITVGAGYKWENRTDGEVVFIVRRRGQPLLHIWPYENPNVARLADVLALGASVPLVVASPIEACSRLRNAAKGAVVVVRRGSCDYFAKAQAIVDAQGIAMLVVNNASELLFPKPLTPGTRDELAFPGLPASIIREAYGNWIADNSSSGPLTIARELVSPSINNIAPFSSFGPLSDGRVKPDIIAPGNNIASAGTGSSAGGACHVKTTTMSGTSMATPTAAGHAALIKEYFRKGFYPDGEANAKNGFDASGMLVKAVIIAGAAAMTGGVHMGLGWRLGPSPDGFQGWGRMSLAGSLPLRGYSDAGLRLQVADAWEASGAFTANGQQETLEGLAATGDGPLTVVLTWYDYPSDVAAASALVNDLDLVVELGGRRLRGNNLEDDRQQRADTVNTVERVVVPSATKGSSIKITVLARKLGSVGLDGPDAQLPQRWAVAVVGHFSGTISSPLNPAWGRSSSSAPLHDSMPPPPSRRLLPPPGAPRSPAVSNTPGRSPPRPRPSPRPPPSTSPSPQPTQPGSPPAATTPERPPQSPRPAPWDPGSPRHPRPSGFSPPFPSPPQPSPSPPPLSLTPLPTSPMPLAPEPPHPPPGIPLRSPPSPRQPKPPPPVRSPPRPPGWSHSKPPSPELPASAPVALPRAPSSPRPLRPPLPPRGPSPSRSPPRVRPSPSPPRVRPPPNPPRVRPPPSPPRVRPPPNPPRVRPPPNPPRVRPPSNPPRPRPALSPRSSPPLRPRPSPRPKPPPQPLT